MKAIVRTSDGLVACMWDHDNDALFAVPEGHEEIEINETLDQFETRVGGFHDKGAPELVGGELRCRAPEPPLTTSGRSGEPGARTARDRTRPSRWRNWRPPRPPWRKGGKADVGVVGP